MKLLTRCALLSLALPLVLSGFVQAQPLTVDVDCDAGDDLAQVLREIESMLGGSGPSDDEGSDEGSDAPGAAELPVIVNVAGTCVANLTITIDNLILRGTDDGSTTIEGSPDLGGTPVVEARYVQHLYLQGLTVRGGRIGIRLAHSLAVIYDCRVTGNGTGLQSENSRSYVVQTRFDQNRDAIFTFGGDHLLLGDFSVVDNSQIGIHAVGSSVTIDEGEIRDNRFGISLHDQAAGFLRRGLVIGDTGGGAALAVVNNSNVTVNDGVIIDSNDNVEVGNLSILTAHEARIAADIVLFQSGKAFLNDTVIDGNVLLYDFSQARLDGDVAGFAFCDPTSDAVCEDGSIGAGSSCEHCVVPPPGDQESGTMPPRPDVSEIRHLGELALPPVENPATGSRPAGGADPAIKADPQTGQRSLTPSR